MGKVPFSNGMHKLSRILNEADLLQKTLISAYGYFLEELFRHKQ